LHVVEGELPPRRESVIPGHQIVGDVVEGATATLPIGARVGVSWIGGVDGDCWYCTHGAENLCDAPTFTGYSVDGGYAEYTLARGDFVFPLPPALDDLRAAPLLCAGIIGFRSLRVAGVQRKSRSDSSGSGRRLIWRSPYCMPGDVPCTSRPVVPPTGSWPPRWVRPGSARNGTSRPCRWIAP
jgi:propanol-preferring alcohol dehydrogenase